MNDVDPTETVGTVFVPLASERGCWWIVPNVHFGAMPGKNAEVADDAQRHSPGNTRLTMSVVVRPRPHGIVDHRIENHRPTNATTKQTRHVAGAWPMTAEHRHHITGSWWLALVLAVTAGFVDSFIYLRVSPVFVANMSGNLIRLGIATGQWHTASIAASGAALAGFIAGVTYATSHLDAQLVAGKALHPLRLLVGESAMLVVVAVYLRVGHVSYSPAVIGKDYLVIAVGATAMGLQSVALRRVGQVAVSTTYGTGAIVRLGEKLALSLRRTERPSAHRRRVTIAILSSVLLGYIAGAAIGAAVGSSPYLLLVAGVVPAMSAVLVHVQRAT